eukprot:3210417-Amphidinium_carterae.1
MEIWVRFRLPMGDALPLTVDSSNLLGADYEVPLEQTPLPLIKKTSIGIEHKLGPPEPPTMKYH